MATRLRPRRLMSCGDFFDERPTRGQQFLSLFCRRCLRLVSPHCAQSRCEFWRIDDAYAKFCQSFGGPHPVQYWRVVLYGISCHSASARSSMCRGRIRCSLHQRQWAASRWYLCHVLLIHLESVSFPSMCAHPPVLNLRCRPRPPQAHTNNFSKIF